MSTKRSTRPTRPTRPEAVAAAYDEWRRRSIEGGTREFNFEGCEWFLDGDVWVRENGYGSRVMVGSDGVVRSRGNPRPWERRNMGRGGVV